MNHTLTQQIEVFLHYCTHQKKLDLKTLKAYRIDLTQLSVFLPDEAALNKSSITEYIQELHTKYKPKTVKRKIACIRSFINYMEFEEIIEENPMSKMRLSFKEPIALPKALSLRNVQKLLHTAHQTLEQATTCYRSKTALRNAAVLELLFATGLRVSELCSITSQLIDLRDGSVKVNGKGSRERIVFVANTETLSILREYSKSFKSEISGSGYFFVNRFGQKLSEQSVRSMITLYAEKAKLSEHITPHMLRHLYVNPTLKLFAKKFIGQWLDVFQRYEFISNLVELKSPTFHAISTRLPG